MKLLPLETLPIRSPGTQTQTGASQTFVGRIGMDTSQLVRVEGFFSTGSRSKSRAVLDNELYFSTRTGLWKSDGTEEGTRRLKVGSVGPLTAFNDRLYFTAGDKLWVTDGTEPGTTLVKDVKPCESNCDEWVSYGHTELNGNLFFMVHPRCYSTADPRCLETELWKSDGTSDGTQFVMTIPRGREYHRRHRKPHLP